jgi:hypothetical protein
MANSAWLLPTRLPPARAWRQSARPTQTPEQASKEAFGEGVTAARSRTRLADHAIGGGIGGMSEAGGASSIHTFIATVVPCTDPLALRNGCQSAS